MVYWKGEKYWVGKLIDHPEVMTQGETLEELEEDIVDAYRLLVLDKVPGEHKAKEIVASQQHPGEPAVPSVGWSSEGTVDERIYEKT